jgi:SnoaL-like protein
MMLGPDEALAFAERWLPAWTGNRPQRLLAYYADDVFYSDPRVPEGVRGKPALTRYFTRLLSDYPDWVWEHERSVPLFDGFLNDWKATVPVGGEKRLWHGVCTVQIRQDRIYRDEVFFQSYSSH